MKAFTGKKLLAVTVLVVVVVGLSFAWLNKGRLIRLAGWPFLPAVAPPASGVLRFAALGDYGSGKLEAGDVAKLIKSWDPAFIVTLGDNNYPEGARETIDQNIGKFYHDFISPYAGRFGQGAAENKFFPIPGHRDWDTDQLRPYLDYFNLPGNERYYTFKVGPVQLFMLDTDSREPDGATQDSIQADWLKRTLSESPAVWKIVCAHHAPYTSHAVEDVESMRWPFKAWGADVVLSGYFHIYERLLIDGLTYIVNGTGGAWVSGFGDTDPNSKVRYNQDNGALMIDADRNSLSFRFVNRRGDLIDTYSIDK